MILVFNETVSVCKCYWGVERGRYPGTRDRLRELFQATEKYCGQKCKLQVTLWYLDAPRSARVSCFTEDVRRRAILSWAAHPSDFHRAAPLGSSSRHH